MTTTTTCVALLVCLLGQAGAPGNHWYHKKIAKPVCHYTVEQPSWRTKIDPLTVLAFMYHETRFRHTKKFSRTDDIGIMQLHCPESRYTNWMCDSCDIRKLRCNIKNGIKYIRWLRDTYGAGSTHRRAPPPSNWIPHWPQYYNYYSKGYYLKIARIKNNLQTLATVKCDVNL